jgi:TolB-like protein/cytochrome c-type biogenesis protein CcmH/NrfG
MAESGPRGGSDPGGSSTTQRLESWKEIASYLRRDKRTVQRWEREYGLPVHRLQLKTGSTVYAFAAELDSWYAERQPPNFPSEASTSEADDGDDERPVEVSVEAPPGAGVSIDPQADLIAVAPSAEVETGGGEKESRQARRRVIRLQITLTLSIVLAAFLAYSLTVRWRAKAPSGKIRLVVLPLANLSGDPQQDYFSAGLTDEMITQLGRLNPQRLGVIAADSSKRLAGKPIAELGRALDVQYALEGSVVRGGNQVRINVQLIQVSDLTHLWADSYTGDLGDILRVQEEVAAAVANQIRVALPVSTGGTTSTTAKGARAVNPEAYDAYLQGRFYWTNRGDLHKSIEAYQRAIQKDPGYALAYAGLASAYTLLSQAPYDYVPPVQGKPKAREAAERALELDPQLAEAHAVLANVAYTYDWDFRRAEREFEQAFKLDPNNLYAHQWYSLFCMARNRLDQAQEENARTLDLDPVSPLFKVVRAEIFYHQRQYDAAITEAQRTIEQYPTYSMTYIWLGSAYREKKMYKQALDAFSLGRKLSGDSPVMIGLHGQALAVSGDAAGARKTLAELRSLSRSRYVSPLYFAAVYTGLGEKSKALDWLDKAYQDRNDYLARLEVEPSADPLRSEPRFQDLLRRVGSQP